MLVSLLLSIYGCQSIKPNDQWQSLFNGKDLTGWSSEHENAFVVAGGNLVSNELPAILYYAGEGTDADFRNFEFSAEVKTSTQAKASLLFHTSPASENALPGKGYHVQIMNSGMPGSDFRKTGSLLAIRDVYKSTVSDNEWFTLNVLVVGNRIQVYVDGVQTVDYTQPLDVQREEHIAQRLLSSGSFAIQTYGKPVSFKNIQLRALPDDETIGPGTEYFTPEKQQMVNTLIGRGYPLIDYHVHLKGGLTLDQILDKSRQTGIFCSVAPNCGVGFPIDTNDKLEEFYATYKDVPIFLAMQAEGREWVHTFEKESIARYDYVFTDAMTFSDRQGNRMQIWKDEQVNITDPQDFMELLVETIEDVMDHEKVDMYVNATFLPTVIADQYDELWTEERMDRVVDALVRNDIALEISARYRIPGAALIKKAKARGVKFTFGTNNADHDFANLDYCFDMIAQCDLQPGDFFLPRPHGFKPVQIK